MFSPGVRVLEAVNRPELKHLTNCIGEFFIRFFLVHEIHFSDKSSLLPALAASRTAWVAGESLRG
jgi:hypothetical protein